MTFSDGPRRASDGPLRLPMVDETPGSSRLPGTRGECQGDGVCPVLRCRYNLAMHVTAAGTIIVGARGHNASGISLTVKRTAAGKERRAAEVTTQMALAVVEMTGRLDSLCALDYADRGGMSLSQIGAVLGVSRERVRAMLDEIFAKLRRDPEAMRVLGEWASCAGSGAKTSDPRP